MVSGSGNDKEKREASSRLGIPIELVEESEKYSGLDDGVYPDNVAAVMAFSDMGTQWRTGPRGFIGLDYNVLPFVFDTRQVSSDKRAEIFDCLQIMERAALEYFMEK